MSELAETIESNAQKPRMVTIDGQQAVQHTLKDQIEADRYLQSQQAATGQRRGLNFARMKPPGAV
jgi:uncharacterized protein YaiL (DUF2058 family)